MRASTLISTPSASLRCRSYGGLRRKPRSQQCKNDTEDCIEPVNAAVSTAKYPEIGGTEKTRS